MYQALYRKWRPRTFDDVVGQRHITETLKNQVRTGRLSHAYLFIGTRGTGKTTCAKILAKAVNCENPQNGNPCNECPTCRGIDDGSIMDVVEMDAASNNGVDNVRALRDEAIFSPASAKKRVYIVDEVHMLSTAAFNALLKILEEPPEHLMFILATTELQKVPATILSRCQRHSFKRLDMKSLTDRLDYVASQEHIDLRPDGCELIARLSDGGMRDALSLLDQCSGRETIDAAAVYDAMGLAGRLSITEMLGHISSGDTQRALELFGELWQNGKDPASLLGEISALQRDILIKKVAPRGGAELMTGGYDENTLRTFADCFTAQTLINDINIIQDTLGAMRTGQARVLCELCLIQLCEDGLGDGLPLLRERVARLEQAVRTGEITVKQESAPPRAERPAPKREETPAAAQEPPFERDEPPMPDDRDAPLPDDREAPPFDMAQRVPERTAPARPTRPTPPVTAQPAPAQRELPPQDADWEKAVSALKGRLPPGIYMLLGDPMQVSGAFSGDTLTLSCANDFAMNNINRPDVSSRIASAVGESLGRTLRVEVKRAGETPAEEKPQPKSGKLDELSKFDIVTIK